MSVVLLLIPQGPGGLAARGSSRRPLRDETETVPGLGSGLCRLGWAQFLEMLAPDHQALMSLVVSRTGQSRSGR